MTQKTKLRVHTAKKREELLRCSASVQRVEIKTKIDAAEGAKPMRTDHPVTAVVAMITNSLERAAVMGATMGGGGERKNDQSG